MTTSLLHSQSKCLRFLSLLIRLSVYQTQASLFGILITFVNTFRFNLVCVFYLCILSGKLNLYEATCFIIKSVTTVFLAMIVMNLVTPKVGAKHELLFTKPASDCITLLPTVIKMHSSSFSHMIFFSL
jgi:hypothetical protein